MYFFLFKTNRSLKLPFNFNSNQRRNKDGTDFLNKVKSKLKG